MVPSGRKALPAVRFTRDQFHLLRLSPASGQLLGLHNGPASHLQEPCLPTPTPPDSPSTPSASPSPKPPAGKLARFALFLRQVRHLALPYFRSEERWKAWGLLLAVVGLNLAAVYMLVLLNSWNKLFYDALQNKDAAVFWQQLGRFFWLAVVFIAIAIYRFYLTQLLQLRWRAWMTRNLMARWLRDHNFYRLELARFAREPGHLLDAYGADNPDQRLQEDVNLFTTQTVSLSMGALNAVVTLLSFVGILWGLSGVTTIPLGGSSIQVQGFMVWMAVLYCGVGSLITHWIGRPLIGLNFEQQKREANYRHHLMRVREYSEAIALDRGERAEGQQLELRFGAVLANYLQLIKKQKQLIGFTNLFGQAAVVFPFIVAAPRFFSGAIQLGDLMQISSAFDRVQGALSWFVDNYDSLAAWRATTERLTSFEAMLARQEALGQQQHAQLQLDEGGPALAAQDLRTGLPDGSALLASAALAAQAGERVWIQGPSGSGKSTLLRTLAGIWPWARGRVQLPAHTMVIPQTPYIPDGALRDALTYPGTRESVSDEALQTALREAALPQLAGELDTVRNWAQSLSGGEQQRLAIARVLLRQPAWVLADEATSGLDTPTAQVLYAKLQAMTAARGGGMVSIAHGEALAPFHTTRWQLVPDPDGRARYTVQVQAV